MEGNTLTGFPRATQCEGQTVVYEDPAFPSTIFICPPPPMHPFSPLYYIPAGDFHCKNDENHQPIRPKDKSILHSSPNNYVLAKDAKSVRQPQNPNWFFAREIILAVVATFFKFRLGLVAFLFASK